jgi:subtilisin family serine protease
MIKKGITNERNPVSRRRLARLSLILISLPLWAQIRTELYQGLPVVANEVLVKFKTTPGVSVPTVIAQIKLAEDIDAASAIGAGDVWTLHSRSKGAATLVRELSGHPEVIYAEPDFVVRAQSNPNDPYFGNLWGLHNTGQIIQGVTGKPGADISATSAWNVTTGSAANVVAVVDTGIDYHHPDLAANVWSAPTSFTVTIGGTPITCPVGSHGFNAITSVCDPYDDNHHGTHVSGTIGAVGNNNLGVVGVNWTASIMGVKFLDSGGSGTTSGAINAIEFAVQAKAQFGSAASVRVLSNSWGGGGFSQALLDEINRANNNDMLFVAAAGNYSRNNDVYPFFPASYNAPNVIAVAATGNTDARAAFSNYGVHSVDLGAPGVNVFSTFPGGSYGFLSGTSMATPHVSGAAALVLSRCALNTADLRAALVGNVDPIPSLAGITITGGRLNVSKAISSCTAPTFLLTATPVYRSKVAIAYFKVGVTAKNGFNGTVALSCNVPDYSCLLNPATIFGSGTSKLTGPPFAGDWDGATLTATSGSIKQTLDLTQDIIIPEPCPVKPCR